MSGIIDEAECAKLIEDDCARRVSESREFPADLQSVYLAALADFYQRQLSHVARSSDPDILGNLCGLFPVLSEYVLTLDNKSRAKLRVQRSQSYRRSVGAYYTPQHITDCMVRLALTPLLTSKGLPKSPAEILNIRVLDPAVGSGNFLLSAARMLAKTYALSSEYRVTMRQAMSLVADHCLFGVDVNQTAVALARKSLEIETGCTGNIMCADALGDKAFPYLVFECVLCNPPYVSFYSRQSQSSSGRRVTQGRENLFLKFMDGTDGWLAEGGRTAFIVPDTIMVNNSFVSMRKKLTPVLEKVIWLQQPVFKDAVVGSAVLVWGREPRTKLTVCRSGGLEDADAANRIDFDTEQVLRSDGCRWGVSVSASACFYSAAHRLEDVVYIRDGINPGTAINRERMLVSDGACVGDCEPCLEGKDIGPFRIAKSRFGVRSSPDLLTKEDRRLGASLREPWIFHSPKIIYRQTAPRVIAAVDLQAHRTLNSCHNIILRKHDETVLFALCAYLNSDFFRDYYQLSTGETRVSFPQVHIASMKRLLVPAEIFDASSGNTMSLAELSRCLHCAECDREGDLARINAIVSTIV